MKLKSFREFVDSFEGEEVDPNTIPAGVYQATTSGYCTTFIVNGVYYRAIFDYGVRGQNLTGTITVNGGIVNGTVLIGPPLKVIR